MAGLQLGCLAEPLARQLADHAFDADTMSHFQRDMEAISRAPLRPLIIDTDFPTDALPPFRTEDRIYAPPATPKSKRQAAALEAALRKRSADNAR